MSRDQKVCRFLSSPFEVSTSSGNSGSTTRIPFILIGTYVMGRDQIRSGWYSSGSFWSKASCDARVENFMSNLVNFGEEVKMDGRFTYNGKLYIAPIWPFLGVGGHKTYFYFRVKRNSIPVTQKCNVLKQKNIMLSCKGKDRWIPRDYHLAYFNWSLFRLISCHKLNH